MSDTTVNADIEEILELIDAADTQWCVDDWTLTAHMSDSTTATIELSYEPKEYEGITKSEQERKRIQKIKEIISTLETKNPNGAPIESVIDRAREEDMVVATVRNEIDALRSIGEVYEPSEGHLRTLEL